MPRLDPPGIKRIPMACSLSSQIVGAWLFAPSFGVLNSFPRPQNTKWGQCHNSRIDAATRADGDLPGLGATGPRRTRSFLRWKHVASVGHRRHPVPASASGQTTPSQSRQRPHTRLYGHDRYAQFRPHRQPLSSFTRALLRGKRGTAARRELPQGSPSDSLRPVEPASR